MKIAILLSGRIYNNLEQYQNILDSLVQNNDVDFFISYPKNTNKSIVKWVSNTYKPKVLFENPEDYYDVKNYNKPPETNSHNVMCMYLSRANLCRQFVNYINQTDENYECVISTRMDLFYKIPMNYNDILTYISDEKSIIIPENGDYRNGINDQFSIGNTSSIQTYMNVYYNIKYFLESGVLLHPETLLRMQLTQMLLSVYRINFLYELRRY